jgi:hypothetical protein
VPEQVGKDAVREIFDETLLFGIAGQIAQRRDGHGSARQQTRPLWQRLFRFSRSRDALPW